MDEALREANSDRWERSVPDAVDAHGTDPLLSGASVVVDEGALRRFLDRLIAVASRDGTPKMATLPRAMSRELDVAGLLAASVSQATDRVTDVATASGADPEALQAVAALVSIPFLQACHRRWGSSVPNAWASGYCPLCGSWPAFAELRGIERSRHLRCGRCGAAWHSRVLHCAYCANTNHDELATLSPEKPGSTGSVDACKRCRGYVKVFTRLQGCPPAQVMLADLASVDLDVAALEQGYMRRAGAGCQVNLSVVFSVPGFLSWNA
jgi:FdhE protein